jgi:hypothetical protein
MQGLENGGRLHVQLPGRKRAREEPGPDNDGERWGALRWEKDALVPLS